MVIRRFRTNGKKHSPEQFERIIEPHLPHLYQLAYRFCNDQADAEDLVQDVVIKLLSRNQEIAQIEKLRPWLAKILYRTFIDTYRKNERSPLSLLNSTDDSLSEQAAPKTENPEFQTEQQVTQQHLQQALQSLNEDQRAVVLLHDVEGYTLLELETILDSPLGTLKSRLNRARHQLREKLKNHQK